jgi:GGDEF domain-containing protein
MAPRRRTGQTLALTMLDVDYFKKYNDHYGHLAGDSALRTVADLITSHGRRTSDLVARYGGEEFALLAAATDATDAFGVAQAICAELAPPVAARGLAVWRVDHQHRRGRHGADRGQHAGPAGADGRPRALPRQGKGP